MRTRHRRRFTTTSRSATEVLFLTQLYDVHNRAEGKSLATLRWYNDTLDLLLRWLINEGRFTTVKEVTEHTLREFILHLQAGRGVRPPPSTSTVNTRVRAVRAFFAWVHRRGYMTVHILQNLRPPKIVQHVVEPLTEEEIGRLFAHCKTTTFLGARNTAFLALLLDTGLRLNEALTMSERDVHLQDRYVKAMG